ncbi:c-type cytochrome [Roseomonas sp. WA12]
MSRISLRVVLALQASLAGTVPALAQDADAGGRLFRQRCQSCHTIEPGQRSPLGPNLADVVNRPAGSLEYNYSTAMKNSGLTWSADTLDRFLAAPSRLVPGTRMNVALIDTKQRSDVIAYLSR